MDDIIESERRNSRNALSRRNNNPTLQDELIWSGYYGKPREILIAVLDKGVSVNCSDEFGMTPLIRTVKEGHSDCTAILIDLGADVDKALFGHFPSIMCAQNHGSTALSFAAEEGHLSCVNMLLEAGANVHGRSLTNYSFPDEPLWNAVSKIHIHVVRRLIDAGAGGDDIDRCRGRGEQMRKHTLLMIAVSPNTPGGLHGLALPPGDYLECISLLLQQERINITINAIDGGGHSALFYALEYSFLEVVTLLVEHGSHIREEDLSFARNEQEGVRPQTLAYLVRIDQHRRRMPFATFLHLVNNLDYDGDADPCKSLMKVFQNADLAKYIRQYL